MASSTTNEKAARLDKLEEAMDILASKIDHQFQISSQGKYMKIVVISYRDHTRVEDHI